jgi:hypothetical protein
MSFEIVECDNVFTDFMKQKMNKNVEDEESKQKKAEQEELAKVTFYAFADVLCSFCAALILQADSAMQALLVEEDQMLEASQKRAKGKKKKAKKSSSKSRHPSANDECVGDDKNKKTEAGQAHEDETTPIDSQHEVSGSGTKASDQSHDLEAQLRHALLVKLDASLQKSMGFFSETFQNSEHTCNWESNRAAVQLLEMAVNQVKDQCEAGGVSVKKLKWFKAARKMTKRGVPLTVPDNAATTSAHAEAGAAFAPSLQPVAESESIAASHNSSSSWLSVAAAPAQRQQRHKPEYLHIFVDNSNLCYGLEQSCEVGKFGEFLWMPIF